MSSHDSLCVDKMERPCEKNPFAPKQKSIRIQHSAATSNTDTSISVASSESHYEEEHSYCPHAKTVKKMYFPLPAADDSTFAVGLVNEVKSLSLLSSNKAIATKIIAYSESQGTSGSDALLGAGIATSIVPWCRRKNGACDRATYGILALCSIIQNASPVGLGTCANRDFLATLIIETIHPMNMNDDLVKLQSSKKQAALYTPHSKSGNLKSVNHLAARFRALYRLCKDCITLSTTIAETPQYLHCLHVGCTTPENICSVASAAAVLTSLSRLHQNASRRIFPSSIWVSLLNTVRKNASRGAALPILRAINHVVTIPDICDELFDPSASEKSDKTTPRNACDALVAVMLFGPPETGSMAAWTLVSLWLLLARSPTFGDRIAAHLCDDVANKGFLAMLQSNSAVAVKVTSVALLHLLSLHTPEGSYYPRFKHAMKSKLRSARASLQMIANGNGRFGKDNDFVSELLHPDYNEIHPRTVTSLALDRWP